jgi:hypothetical protein
MTTLHGRTTLAALALLVFGCSIGAARTFYARPHGMSATAHINRFYYHSWYYSRLDSLIYAINTDQAFIRFDLPSLPVGATVVQAWASYHQTQGSPPYPRTGLICLQFDPLSRGNELLWNDIYLGTPVSDTTTNAGQVWIRKAISAYGLSVLQSSLTQGWFALGVRAVTGSGRASSYAPDSTHSPLLEVGYALPGDPDVAVLGMELLTSPLVAGEIDSVSVTLTNNLQPSAHDFYIYELRNGVKSDSVFVGSLEQGETARVLLAIHNPTGDSGYTHLCSMAADTSDGWTTNDSSSLDAYTYLPGGYDAAVLEARLTTYPLVAGETDTLEVTLTCVGGGPAAGFYVQSMRNLLRSDSALVERLTLGETARVLVPLHTPLTGTGWTDIRCFSKDPADVRHANDTASLRCFAYPPGAYAVEGFEATLFPPNEWDTLDNGGVGNWQRGVSGNYANSGDGAAYCGRDRGTRNDDWLISSALTPIAGHADSACFYYRGLRALNSDSLEVWALGSQNRTDTLAELTAVELSSSTYHLVRFGLDQFDNDTIFVGIRNVSSNDRSDGYAFVDDVCYLRRPSGGVEAPTGTSLPVSFSVIPNPARSGKAVSIRFPAGEPARLSVYDALGRSVWSTPIPRTQAADTRPLVLPRLAAGVYLVRLESGPDTATAKLVIRP